MKCYIVATGEYCNTFSNLDTDLSKNQSDDDTTLPPLKPLVKEATGRSVRRISRFIELALIGAGRAANQTIDNTAVYLTSGRGDIEITATALDSLYRLGEAPRPLTFINTVSNAATFYVAQCLGLQSSSFFISSRYFALEMGLKSACLDLTLGRSQAALVGAVDIVTLPIKAHRQRLKLSDTRAVTEASYWLQLVAEPENQKVLAVVELVQQFPNRLLLAAWLQQQDFHPAIQLAIGQSMGKTEAAEWLAHTQLTEFLYCEGIGHFDSQAGLALNKFVKSSIPALLYINRDPRGRYTVVLLSR